MRHRSPLRHDTRRPLGPAQPAAPPYRRKRPERRPAASHPPPRNPKHFFIVGPLPCGM
jgi:hypothetical protein